MEKLLQLFKSEPSDHLDTFLEYESELLMLNNSYSFNQSKMRGALIDWVNTQVNPSGFEIAYSPSGFTVSYLDQETDYTWCNADALYFLIETIKNEA